MPISHVQQFVTHVPKNNGMTRNVDGHNGVICVSGAVFGGLGVREAKGRYIDIVRLIVCAVQCVKNGCRQTGHILFITTAIVIVRAQSLQRIMLGIRSASVQIDVDTDVHPVVYLGDDVDNAAVSHDISFSFVVTSV